MRSAQLALPLAILAASPLSADPVTWLATSKTAMAITGDIKLDDYSVTFANGKSLDLEPYEADRVRDWSGSGTEVAGYVYKIDPAADPKLLNGNKLCGTPVTWVIVWSPGEGELALNTYSGKGAPTSSEGLCASYFYEAP